MLPTLYALSYLLAAHMFMGISGMDRTPQITKQLCEQLRQCAYPKRVVEGLAHHVQTFMGLEASYQEDTYLATLKVLKKCEAVSSTTDLPRLITDSNVLHEEISGTNMRRSNTHRAAYTFFVHLPASITGKGCSLTSMAVSTQFPEIVYLLVQCVKFLKCFRNLYLVDLKHGKMIPEGVEFCEPREGERYILIGPCVYSKARDCLYSVNGGFSKMSLTTYHQPSVTTKRLVKEKAWHSFRHINGRQLCSFSQSKRLYCLYMGFQLFQVYMEPNTSKLNFKQLNWRFERFSNINAFMIDETAISDALIVQESFVTLVKLDFERKEIYRKKSIMLKGIILTFFDGYALFHSKSFGKPYCTCRTDALQTCTRKLKSV